LTQFLAPIISSVPTKKDKKPKGKKESPFQRSTPPLVVLEGGKKDDTPPVPESEPAGEASAADEMILWMSQQQGSQGAIREKMGLRSYGQSDGAHSKGRLRLGVMMDRKIE
jgi:hypothetical protein